MGLLSGCNRCSRKSESIYGRKRYIWSSGSFVGAHLDFLSRTVPVGAGAVDRICPGGLVFAAGKAALSFRSECPETSRARSFLVTFTQARILRKTQAISCRPRAAQRGGFASRGHLAMSGDGFDCHAGGGVSVGRGQRCSGCPTGVAPQQGPEPQWQMREPAQKFLWLWPVSHTQGDCVYSQLCM